MVIWNDIKIADKGFLINLDERTDRLEESLSEFERLNIKGVERFSAIKITEDSDKGWVIRGCTHSHMDILKSQVENGWEKVVIFEDDFFLDVTHPEITEISDEHIKKINQEDFDLLMLGGVLLSDSKFENENLIISDEMSQTTSYISSLKFAKFVTKIFDYLDTESVFFSEAIDSFYSFLARRNHWKMEQNLKWVHELINHDQKIYVFSPILFSQRPSHSDIMNKFVSYSHYNKINNLKFWPKEKIKIQNKLIDMNQEKTLIITSIYANLWGTELGGRPSREYHYKVSLLNILNLNPSKVICFTSQEELPQLEQFFYSEKNINQKFLEFRVFNLTTTRYFNKIKSKKDLDFMKSFDRCYEIQYNKLFWSDNLPDILDFDKVYWFDAGLSHGGLFPEDYSYGNGFDRNFQFNLFNNDFLSHLNNLSQDKFILVGKNNDDAFYWSTTLPEKYYTNYNKNIHVVGGFFGGSTEMYRKVSKMFDDLLVNLLISEDGLFVEEQILTTVYYNNPEIFEILNFDDWYKRDTHDEKVKYFYELFIIDKKYGEVINEVSESEKFTIRVRQIIFDFLKEKNLI